MASKARKTVEVATVKMMANMQLKRTDITTEARKAIAGFIEAVLFEANAYQGYNHVYWSREGGYDAWVAAGKPEGAEKQQYIYGPGDTDDYRRFYY
jgi:hypothetical protein